MKKLFVIIFLVSVFLYPAPYLYPVQAITDAPSPTPSSPSEEESAIYKINQGTLPSEVVKKEPDLNTVEQIQSTLGTVLARFIGLFYKAPDDKAKYYAGSDTLHQANLPDETKKKDPDIVETLKGYLGVGTSAGIYSSSIPTFEGFPTDKATPYEDIYQKSYFPEGIKPIVPNTPTPTPRNNPQ